MTTSSLSRMPTWAFSLCCLLSAATGLFVGGILGAAVADLAGMPNAIIVMTALVGTFVPPVWMIAARHKLSPGARQSNPVAVGLADTAAEEKAATPQLSRKMKIAIALASIATVAIYNFWPSQDPYGLATRIEGQGGAFKGVTITNTKTTPIKITDASINERKECLPFPTALPKELKEGDQIMLLTACEVMRLIVKTEKGSATYTFK